MFLFFRPKRAGYKDKLLTKPSKKNYKAIVDKVRSIIKSNATCRQEDLIRQLNPVIRGWVNYQKYNVSHEAFVIAVSTIYSNSLSVAISKSIEKPLNELKDRFITFAEGDIDSPLQIGRAHV